MASINKFFENPKAAIEKHKEAVAAGTLSEKEQVELAPVIKILERIAELQDIAVQAEAVKQSIKTEEKVMKTTTTTTASNANAAAAELPAVDTSLVGVSTNTPWVGIAIASVTALATSGFDMVLNDDLSKTRIIGSIGTAVVAAGVQYLIQDNLTNEQSTAVNGAIGAGVGLVSGGLGRLAIDLAQEKFAASAEVEI